MKHQFAFFSLTEVLVFLPMSFFLLFSLPAHADDDTVITIQKVITDNGRGHRGTMLTQKVPAGIVSVVEVLGKKLSGEQLYVQARFGRGHTIQEPEKMYPRSPDFVRLRWKIEQDIKRRPLMIEVHDGSFELYSVRIYYSSREPDKKTNSTLHSSVADKECAEKASEIADPTVTTKRVVPSENGQGDSFQLYLAVQGQCLRTVRYLEYDRVIQTEELHQNFRSSSQNVHFNVVPGRRGRVQVVTTGEKAAVLLVDDPIMQYKTAHPQEGPKTSEAPSRINEIHSGSSD